MAETGSGRDWSVAGGGFEPRCKPAAIVFVVVDQLWYRVAAVLLRQEELALDVLLYVVVLHVRMRTDNTDGKQN